MSSAVQLRFDIRASSLPDACKQRLLALPDRRISRDGVIVIRAQRYRDREKNRLDALARLHAMVDRAMSVPRRRIPTRVTTAAKKRRLEEKMRRGREKQLRRKISADD